MAYKCGTCTRECGECGSDYREPLHACLDELHATKLRIASLEEQLKAAREEIRRYVSAKIGE